MNLPFLALLFFLIPTLSINAENTFNTIDQSALLLYKRSIQKKIMSNVNNDNKSSIQRNDEVRNLVTEVPINSNLLDLARTTPTQKTLDLDIWSDYYWPYASGLLGNRYSDSTFTNIDEFLSLKNYVVERSASHIFLDYREEELSNLSPSEKYDLLFGKDLLLTNQMWKESYRFYEPTGNIETWMGLCHGWAAASMMVQRPKKMINVKSFDGKTIIPFYPSDIKALATLLWAKANFSTRFIGGRCNDKEDSEDSEERETRNQDCIDNNPGTFHLAVLHQMGKANKSFVIDATPSYEVWNHPVKSYSYTYFNPLTNKETSNIQEALVDYRQYKEKDKKSSYRHPKTKNIIGVSLELGYLIETSPNHEIEDSNQNDGVTVRNLTYDLELDENMQILGGEWISKSHPDFMWLPVSGSTVLTIGDYYNQGKANWTMGEAIPKSWFNGQKESAKEGLPLATVVNQLVLWSRQ